MNTRAIAAGVLIRITDEGAYSNVVLPHETKDLSRADAGFVLNLVYGTLRRLRLVDRIIEEATGRDLAALDVEVRAILEVAIAELLTDDRDAAYATVNESVEAVKDLGRGRAASFVNAVLRSLLRSGMPDLGSDLSRDLSIPDWVLAAMQTDHGPEEATAALTSLRSASPYVSIRVRPSGVVPSGARPVPGIADAYYLDGSAGADDGFVYADAASIAVGNAVDVRPGTVTLDMAAAPGGKTMHLIDTVGSDGTIVAMDAHRRRLQSARRRLERIEVNANWVTGDARNAPFRDASFDSVLLDAPCTGLGTLRRRPEIAMRLESGAPENMARHQAKMLEEAWRLTRPGGRIVYSVCTLFAAETIEVVAPYPARPPEGVPGRHWGKGGLLAPHLTGTDGMFISVIER